ncbi:CDP-glycerol glycerophosphotransferase family protein [Staphylococcus equorum]|uniref:CDP-glycerol glycerophosphotransferase family protein n=1 Tax=Staphylococcus equorum TaxID=246432 RepID=UPI0029826429|nr:CDP-glycerol glycerophosphotransferase family protein [Staphylococcus equorum]MDW5472574.1 CDP-glycerol glycerophosphotransferase family protein [Staphylococcus equorum]
MIYKYLYPIFRLLPKNSKKIVYYSYWGDQVSCSPKAIYESMQKNYKDYKNIWMLNDINIPIEGNSAKVKMNSLKYWYHLATAKYFVQNTNMPIWYKKRNGQREVQTFHGTFMKTMGFDTPELKFETRQHKIDEFQKKVDNWDYVSIPSSYMEDKARSAFNTNVKSISAGFPRNDMMFKALNQTNEIREKLSIPADKKVVLYAPTWREAKSSDINMDIDYMQKTLGDNFILLIRAHYMVSNNMDIRKNYPFAINVSNYPSVEELYAISDVLITDYSSVMFDYAYLKKPMIFYAYDLEKYLYGERGVYLDYENIVPGPVVKTTQEIIDNLKDYNNFESKYKEKYELFYNEFCQYGRNGDSASKVIEELIKN